MPLTDFQASVARLIAEHRLYWSRSDGRFVAPSEPSPDVVPHHGRPGGVLPRAVSSD